MEKKRILPGNRTPAVQLVARCYTVSDVPASVEWKICCVIIQHPVALGNDVFFKAHPVVVVDCWCTALSLFYDISTCFDLVRSSSGRFFYMVAALH
jgi:hypothetical protein